MDPIVILYQFLTIDALFWHFEGQLQLNQLFFWSYHAFIIEIHELLIGSLRFRLVVVVVTGIWTFLIEDAVLDNFINTVIEFLQLTLQNFVHLFILFFVSARS